VSDKDSKPSSTQHESQDRTSGTAFGEGPFEEGLHGTPVKSWLSVALMVVGFAVVGVGVVLLNLTSMMTSVVVMAVGAVIGLAGVVLGIRSRLMTNVE